MPALCYVFVGGISSTYCNDTKTTRPQQANKTTIYTRSISLISASQYRARSTTSTVGCVHLHLHSARKPSDSASCRLRPIIYYWVANAVCLSTINCLRLFVVRQRKSLFVYPNQKKDSACPHHTTLLAQGFGVCGRIELMRWTHLSIIAASLWENKQKFPDREPERHFRGCTWH